MRPTPFHHDNLAGRPTTSVRPTRRSTTIRRTTSAGASAALLAALFAVFPGAASAANPPSCVEASSWSSTFYNYGRADNECSSSQRFYFEWRFNTDGPCSTLRAGSWLS